MMQILSPSGIAALSALALLMSSIDQYLFVASGIPPLYLQVASLGIFLAHLAWTYAAGAGRPRITPAQACVFGILYFYIFWTAISYLYSEPSEAVTEVLIARIKAAIFIIVIALMLSRNAMRNAFAWVCVGLVGIATILNIYDFMTPTFSDVPGRSAGLYVNPNVSGGALSALPVMASISVPAIGNFVVVGFAAAGLLLTFSRSGWLIFLFGGLGLALLGKLGGGRARFVFLGVVTLLFGLLFLAYLSGDLYLFLSRSSMGEFLDPNTLARLGSHGVALDDYSSYERSDVADKGLEAFLSAPLLGHGVGYTYIWGDRTSTHNMLLLLGAELGIPGILAYLALFAIMITRAQGVYRLLAIMLFADGLFTHNQLDFISAIIPIAFVIASLGVDREIVRRPAPARSRPRLKA